MAALVKTLPIVLILIATSYQKENFEGFKACLLKQKIHSSRIIERSLFESYNYFNHQWQLKPPNPTPLAYVVVKKEKDVVSTVRCGKKFMVRIVAKGGGHSLEKFSFGNSDSVVVDLRHLSEVSVDRNNLTSVVGPGNLIGPMLWKLWKLAKVFVPGGTCQTVGISGLALGGGHGSFSQVFGLTIDKVLELNVVTANGALLKANSKTNPDLFWALRGGGETSFGIVTKFVFQTIPAPHAVFIGTLFYDFKSSPAAFDAFQKYMLNSWKSFTTSFVWTQSYACIRFIDPTGLAAMFEKVKETFPATNNISRLVFSFPEFLLYEEKTFGTNLRPDVKFDSPTDIENIGRNSAKLIYLKRKSFFVKREIGLPKILLLQELIRKEPPGITVRCEGYGAAISDIGFNETAFVHRESALYNMVATYVGPDSAASGNTLANAWLQKFFDLGLFIFRHDSTYQNYVDIELQDYNERYYGTNLPRLLDVKRKYDPDNYFCNQQSIGLKC